jgi:hypothetical protein
VFEWKKAGLLFVPGELAGRLKACDKCIDAAMQQHASRLVGPQEEIVVRILVYWSNE